MPSDTGLPCPSELRVVATTHVRAAGRLDDAWPDATPDPDIETLTKHAGSATAGEALWLWGGEPCLRHDLPSAIAACAAATPAQLGLRTDALALVQASALAPLRDAGLAALRVILHSSRPAAHDWLVGIEGAGRRALRALRQLADSGLRVEVEATVTRPTAPHLPELFALCRRLGVAALHLRRLAGRGAAAADFIALSPRLALIEPIFDELAGSADAATALVLEDFPACASGAARPCRLPDSALRWSIEPARSDFVAGCPECPGLPACAGAPGEYVALFGRAEFQSEDGNAAATQPPGPASDATTPPPPRHGRAPATRHRVVTSQVDLAIGGDPLAPRAPRRALDVLRIDIAPETPSRLVRQQLVRAAQEGAAALRVDAPRVLQHTDAIALLRECTRLGFERVELETDLRELAAFGDADLYALRGITQAISQLEQPDDYPAAESQLERLARLAGARTGVVARISTPQQAREFGAAWAAGALPEPPRFTLAAGGGSLAPLLAALDELPAASADALAAQFPACLPLERAVARPPCDTVNTCVCAEPQPGCPGVPVGWSLPE